jgi:hypothetical protein
MEIRKYAINQFAIPLKRSRQVSDAASGQPRLTRPPNHTHFIATTGPQPTLQCVRGNMSELVLVRNTSSLVRGISIAIEPFGVA